MPFTCPGQSTGAAGNVPRLNRVVELLEQNLQEEEMTLNRLKVIASEFDVADEAEEDQEQHEEPETTR